MINKTKRLLTVAILCMLLALLPAAAFAAASKVTTDIASQPFVIDEWTEFSFSIEANDHAGKMINARSVFANPDVIDGLEYYEVANSSWQKLSHDPTDLGPVGGFPMGNATMKFRAKINKAGTYSFDVEVYEVGGDTLCETTAQFTVQPGSQLTTDIPSKTFVVGVPTEFTFSTKANGHKGMMVVGTSNFSKPDAIEKLEYFDPATNSWFNMNQVLPISALLSDSR